jgi:hypothetical protein
MATPHQGKIIHRQTFLISLLIGLFIVAQFLASTHASEHVFHTADNSCIMLSSAENNSHDIGLPAFRPGTDGLLLIARSYNRAPLKHQSTRVYQTRAPPLSAS